MVNTFRKNGKEYSYEEKVSKAEVYMLSDDMSEKVRRSHFGSCEIKCIECGNFTHINKIQSYHLKKRYICAKCNHTGEKNPMFGKKFTDEQRKHLSEVHKGEKSYWYGKHLSDETKKKLSESHKGRYEGEKNPMYGINMWKLLEERYGEARVNESKKRTSGSVSGEKNPFYGKKHTDETKKHLSEAIKNSEKHKKVTESPEYREKLKNALLNSEKLKESRKSEEYRNKKRVQFSECIKLGTKPHSCFNPKACRIFDKIMEEQGIFIQHAMNGGEYLVEGLGYWLDGYDAENNVAYEYDENHHFVGGKLRDKDIKRQKEIEEKLHCKFVRLKDEDYKDF